MSIARCFRPWAAGRYLVRGVLKGRPNPLRPPALVLAQPHRGGQGRDDGVPLGVVAAQGVLGLNVFEDVAASMRNIFGGRTRSYETELASGVSDSLVELEKQAGQLGADAVIGVDIDYESVGSQMLMISASGTAVKLA